MQLFYFLAAAALATATTVQFDIQVHYNAALDTSDSIQSPRYDTICMDGPSLEPGTYFPWPYVGGYAPIKKGDSKSCFNCYQLHYGGNSVYFQAINTAKDGVDLGSLLFDQLSGGKAAEVKHINATISMVDLDYCMRSMSWYWLGH